jgi:hypothetical protein
MKMQREREEAKTDPVSKTLCISNVREKMGCRGSLVVLVTGDELNGQGSIPDRGKRYPSTPQRPDWLWRPSSLLHSRYGGTLSQRVKRPGREAEGSDPYGFMALCLMDNVKQDIRIM